MTTASTLDPDYDAADAPSQPPGHDTASLGPSDSSDSGSDGMGPTGYDDAVLADDSDAAGTGADPSPIERNARESGTDIGTDRIVEADAAGLGGGLDQAEEAQQGVEDADDVPLVDDTLDDDTVAVAGADPAAHADVQAGAGVER